MHSVHFGRVSLPATAACGGLALSTGCSASTQSWQAPPTHTKPRPRCDVLPHSSIFGGDSSCTQTRSHCSPPSNTSLTLPSVLDPAKTLQESWQLLLMRSFLQQWVFYWCSHLPSSNGCLYNSSSSALVLTDLCNCATRAPRHLNFILINVLTSANE